MQVEEVARFEGAGDVRSMLIGEEDGCVVVQENLAGPSALIAYGDEERSMRVMFAPEAVRELLCAVGSVGERSLRAYLSREENDIVDLMDLCDARGVAYAFTGMGAKSGVQFRPAQQRG